MSCRKASHSVIIVEATVFNTIDFTYLEDATIVMEMYYLAGMVAEVTANFGPFSSRDFSSGVSSFLDRFITHVSWILEVVEEVAVMLKVLVVLEAILEVIVQHKRQLTLHTFLISIYNRSVIPMFAPFKLQDNWIFWSSPLKKYNRKTVFTYHQVSSSAKSI